MTNLPEVFLLDVDSVTPSVTYQENSIDKNRTEGVVKQAKGSVKETIGKITGNKSTEAEGMAEKIEGQMQTKVGETADQVCEAVKKNK